MIDTAGRAFALATLTLLSAAPALAASPSPASSGKIALPVAPKQKLHTEFVVEVNNKGQVAAVKSKKGCPDLNFNAHTLGNVLQMWIRKADGSAEVGLYRVTFDYNPSTKAVDRRISLVSAGGNWGNKPGAASVMMDVAQKEAAAAAKARPTLPPLNSIEKATPTPHP